MKKINPISAFILSSVLRELISIIQTFQKDSDRMREDSLCINTILEEWLGS